MKYLLAACFLGSALLSGCNSVDHKEEKYVLFSRDFNNTRTCPTFEHITSHTPINRPPSWHNCSGSLTQIIHTCVTITDATNWFHGVPSGVIKTYAGCGNRQLPECRWTAVRGKKQGWKICSSEGKTTLRKFFINGVEATPSQRRDFALKNYRKKCAEIGFKPRTDKFADCVLRMMEMNSSSKPQTVIQNNTGSDPAVRALLEEQKRQRELEGSLELMQRGLEMMQPPKPKLTCTYNPVLRQTTCN